MTPKDIMAQATVLPTPAPSRGAASVLFDNIIRRSLKVDPRDSTQIARALLERFPKEANQLALERKGLSGGLAAMGAVVPAAGPQIIRPEIHDAMSDLRRVLTNLTTDDDLAEINAEMRGWARAIQMAAEEGLTAARFALDPRQSDRAMSARRLLGDYARVCRYAAAASSCAGDVFCRVAQSCDTIANLILIGIGDALNDAGVTRSSSLPRVPATVMQERRNMLLNALEALQQSGMVTPSEDAWPRGIVTLTQIESMLESSDAPDLRAILDPAFLAKQLDELVDLASGATADGLKQLSTVAAMTIQRFRRFLAAVQVKVLPPSPPLTRFVAAIQLFIQGFEGANSGYRLPFLSRSPLLVGQASVTGGIDQPTLDLIQLALARSAMAELIDCLCCSCDDEDAKDLIIFAKVLYDLDRAIDLYGFGTDPAGWGEAEIKAHAYGALLDVAVNGTPPPGSKKAISSPASNPVPFIDFGQGGLGIALQNASSRVLAVLNWKGLLAGQKLADVHARARMMCDVLCLQLHEEQATQKLVAAISPVCRREFLLVAKGSKTELENLIEDARVVIADEAGIKKPKCRDWKGVIMPDHHETSLNKIVHGKPGVVSTIVRS